MFFTLFIISLFCLQALKKALTVDGESLAAWKGLVTLYEETEKFEERERLIEPYQKLVTLLKV